MVDEPAWQPLADASVVNLGVNVPAPVAAWRLAELGATVTKVEPPAGDPLELVSPAWHAQLTHGQTVVRLDLKERTGRQGLERLLADSDLLLTSSRPSALARLGLARSELEARFPRLLQVAIVGHGAPRQDVAGHDLTYVAHAGLATPPRLPLTLLADLGGAERAVTAALALLHGRDRGDSTRSAEVALADAADYYAAPLRFGLTTPEGPLGGGSSVYRFYEAKGGWVAVAALEPHFRARLVAELGLDDEAGAPLEERFRERTPSEWEAWAAALDLPLTAVRISERA